MRLMKLLMLAGLAVAGIGGAAAADPCDEPGAEVVDQPDASYDYDYAPPVVVEQPARAFDREGYGRRYFRPDRDERFRERAYRREERRERREERRERREDHRTARSYRHGSRW